MLIKKVSVLLDLYCSRINLDIQYISVLSDSCNFDTIFHTRGTWKTNK